MPFRFQFARRDEPVIAFIVPAYNEELLLPATLSAVHAAAQALGEPFDIVVADDASTDRTAAVAEEHGARVVRVAHRQIAATRNSGGREAKGDLLIFVDADTVVNSAVVRAAVDAMRNGAVGGGCDFQFEGRLPLWARLMIFSFRPAYRVGRLASGSFLFCTRQAFEAVGGFDATLFAAEEAVMSRALHRQGRFVVLRETVLTSGRKLRAYSAWELLSVLSRLAFLGRRALRKRQGLDIWYGAVAWIRKASDRASERSRRVRLLARRPVDRRLTICGSAMRRKRFRTPAGGSMALLRLRDVTFSYGGASLLDSVSLEIQPGERIGLMGRNGAGKSTLLRLLEGTLQPDDGLIERPGGLRIAQLAQEVPTGTQHTVLEEVARGLGEQGTLVAQMLGSTFHSQSVAGVSHKVPGPLSGELDADTAWKLQRRIEDVISRMDLDPLLAFDTLSSGMKRRVLLAQTLVSEPDILLLDEPTNHLDLDSIRWIEDFLLRESPTLVFVTHDRVFLQRIATRIVEIERARIFDWTCDYATFLVRKEALLAAESQQEALFDKKLAEEEVWIRQGVKARRTRNEGRVHALERLREERRARRARAGNVRLQTQEVERSGNLVIVAEGIGKSFDGRTILDDVTVTISRGDKIGILGPNGSGKTTLLRILLGELQPDRGTVRRGTNLQVAYFDQLRAQLDEDRSAAENVADGNETVLFNGKPRNVLGYLRDFLFSGERARSLVRYLSGGERNRLLLARMFTHSANVLVLDEPTNDLDAETLELLEELLVDFPGDVALGEPRPGVFEQRCDQHARVRGRGTGQGIRRRL